MLRFVNRRWFNTDPSISNQQQLCATAIHLVHNLSLLTIGAAYTSATARAIRRQRNIYSKKPTFSGHLALVVHAYYPELLCEVINCYTTLPPDSDLIVTVPAEKVLDTARYLAGFDRAKVIAVPNCGRDIGPFLLMLNSGLLDKYDVVLKLHTKRSTHLLDGNIRRRVLYAKLAGSNARTAQVLMQFKDPKTGMVGWGPSWRNSTAYWMTNRQHTGELMEAMQLPTPDIPSFFEGSMFWVRPVALNRLRRLKLSIDDFESESGQTDGTLHHAVERIFALAAAADGYLVRNLHGNQLNVVAQSSNYDGNGLTECRCEQPRLPNN